MTTIVYMPPKPPRGPRPPWRTFGYRIGTIVERNGVRWVLKYDADFAGSWRWWESVTQCGSSVPKEES